MEAEVSKAQLEVWEWKASLYEELKKIPKEDWVKYLLEKAKASDKNYKDDKRMSK